MARVKPYHTTTFEVHKVYHDRDDCPVGSQIKRENRIDGTDDRDRCSKCKELDA
jgi:hypothetical protein